MQVVPRRGKIGRMKLLNTDLAHFFDRFEHGLAGMLAPDQLGAFILVLANSMQDERLHQSLQQPLRATFDQLLARHRAGELRGAPDDLAVFEHLAIHGVDDYGAWRSRRVGPWHCAFNPLRALRPERASADVFEQIAQPFDERRFHFDKPFLRPEILVEEYDAGQSIRVMYHKFPFAAYHLLLLIDAAAHLPQYLRHDHHRLFSELVEQLGQRWPGVGLAYNSLGASASINHLHAHGFVQAGAFAVEAPGWRHNGGSQRYPLACAGFDDPVNAWQAVEQLHRLNQPFNLLYRPGRCYVLPRVPQGTARLPAWLPAATWYEVCGSFNLVDPTAFERLDAVSIEAGLGALATGS